MPILTSESYYMKTKITVTKILSPVSIEPLAQDYKSSMFPLPLTGHLLLGRSLNFCFMHHLVFWTLDHLVRINRAWLYKDPKGLASQASAQLG